MRWALEAGMKRHFGFAMGMGILAVCALSGVVGLVRESLRLAELRLEWEELATRWNVYQRMDPVPSRTAWEWADDQLARSRAHQETLRAAWTVWPEVSISDDPLVVLPRVRAAVDEWRRRVVSAGIGISPDSDFGFGRFLREAEAPAAMEIEGLDRQRWATGRLLDLLIESEPDELLSFFRQDDTSPRESGRRPPGVRPFLTQNLSMEDGGRIEGMTFHLGFAGYTESLRRFLNALSSGVLPAVVHSVEVSRRQDEARRDPASRTVNPFFSGEAFVGDSLSAARRNVPAHPPGTRAVIENHNSTFQVVVELFRIVIPEAEPAALSH